MATPETANHKSVINQMSINASIWTGTTIVIETRYKKKLHFHDKGLCQQYFYIKIAVVRLDIKGWLHSFNDCFVQSYLWGRAQLLCQPFLTFNSSKFVRLYSKPKKWPEIGLYTGDFSLGLRRGEWCSLTTFEMVS